MISKKIVTHKFAAETSYCIIATKIVTFITATKTTTNISIAEGTNNIIAVELQNLHNCNRR